jgi:hypothetical protein
VADLMLASKFETHGGHMKSRLLACAVAGLQLRSRRGLTHRFPVGMQAPAYGPFVSGPPAYAGAPRYAVPLDQITANARAAGLQPLGKPMLRGAVYYVRAINPARAEMRVASDARSGRVHRRRASPINRRSSRLANPDR